VIGIVFDCYFFQDKHCLVHGGNSFRRTSPSRKFAAEDAERGIDEQGEFWPFLQIRCKEFYEAIKWNYWHLRRRFSSQAA